MDELAQLKAILDRAKKTAYRSGWDDAVRHIMAAVQLPGPSSIVRAARTQHEDEPPISHVVHELIRTTPGLRGTGIVDAVAAGNPDKPRKSLDRTIRTALKRLKEKGRIESRAGLWYPKEAA